MVATAWQCLNHNTASCGLRSMAVKLCLVRASSVAARLRTAQRTVGAHGAKVVNGRELASGDPHLLMW